jgi:hypothetical protein
MTRTLLRRWPIAAGAALAALVGYDLTGADELAPILAAAALVYLGAAALGRRDAAWPIFLGTFVVITVTKVTPVDVNATWLFLGLAVLFAGYGLARGAARPRHGLPLQAAAMAGFGALAAVTLAAHETAGAFLVAAGLLGHAAWDVHHFRTRRVVSRSLAEFCVVLDALLAVVVVVVALRA